MKNEIGRKLTSLTIMAIMFAGGMTIAAPGILPESTADLSATDGLLTVSTTTLQGAAILEMVVNDPDYSATDNDIANGPTVSIMGSSYDMVQASNGKWYAYVVDLSVAKLMDEDDNGLEFGATCASGIGVKAAKGAATSGSFDIHTANVYANAFQTNTTAALDDKPGGCQDLDGAGTYSPAHPNATVVGADDTTTTTVRELMTAAVLQNAPSLSNHDDKAVDAANADLGQRGHHLNATSGHGSWPYILRIDLADNTEIAYGSDAINVSYGNTDDYTAIGVNNTSVADDTEIHLWIEDPGLNIDPTTADIWQFNLAQSSTFQFMNNGTNATISLAESGEFGCLDNCYLTVDNASTAPSEVDGYASVVMTETGANTGVFESFDSNGDSQLTTVSGATADVQHTFKYGGNSVDIVIAYNDAILDLTAPGAGDWITGESATITLNDPDMNKNPTIAETLSMGNSTHVIPTIKVGSPLTLSTLSLIHI